LLGFPAESLSKPALVEIEYQVPADAPGSAWFPPDLHDGAVVLQTLWDVHIPWNQTLVGVPAGWADENEWYWDLYVWKRRPSRPFSRLLAWVAGTSPQSSSLDEAIGEELDGAHGFLFSRSGAPSSLRPWVVSRASVVAVCSGTVLLLGFYLIFFGARLKILWAVAAAACLAATALAHPSSLLLVLQSSLSGVVLTLLGLVIQRLIERPRQGASGGSQPGSSSGLATAMPAAASGVGSDDSTAIRVRPSSTMDYVSPLGLGTDAAPSRSSSVGNPG
jgi:hypothetical protein